MTTDDLIGKRVGGYEILDKVGQGGMATVYRAQQISMNRTVAIKILPRQFLSDDSYMARFNREVKIVSQLEHRNIVPVYDYGEYDGLPYIIMRYMPAGSIDDVLRKNGPLEAEKILHIVEQIAPALDYAHSKGVLHRDLKPSNVLMDDDGGAYITDFGIARILGETGPGITTQGVVGTPSYMSPEQAQGHELDGRSDVYSLGVMIFEMATGRRPFQSDTPYSIAVMQVTTPPPSPRVYNPRISVHFENVIYRALEKKPERRYLNSAALVDGMRSALTKAKTHDTQPGGVPRMEMTQPTPAQNMAPAQSPPPAQIAPSAAPSNTPAPLTGQPIYQEPFAPSGTLNPPGISYRPQRKKRGSGVLTSFAIGGLLGCGLLVVLAAIAVLVISLLMGSANSASQTSEGTQSGVLPTLDADSLTARANLLTGDGVVVTEEAAPTPSEFSPVGARPTRAAATEPGDALLFFSERSGNYDIYTIDLDTRVETQLTVDENTDSYPAVSPDGSMVVFQSNREGDFELYLMTIYGGSVRRLTTNDVIDRIPSWSPDGAWIVYSADTNNNGNHDLYIIRPDGSQQTLLFSNGQRNSHPRWSPDGRYIVFTTGQSNDAATWEIGRLELNYDAQQIPSAGDFVQLTNNSQSDSSPNFNADGSSIIYISDGIGGAAVARMDIDGNNQAVVYDGPGEEWGAHYSLDGTLIAFNSNMERAAGDDQLYIMNADGTDILQITNDGGYYPSFVP
ncbi:MAG: protein kinase [Chloroflexi bacterium]|nr:protein kinase [Chloroflexota bacterium]